MDYYDKNDPACAGYKVEFQGVVREDAVEASHSGGWMRVEKEVPISWGRTYTKSMTHWGRVFIVKYEVDDEETEEEVEENPEPTYD